MAAAVERHVKARFGCCTANLEVDARRKVQPVKCIAHGPQMRRDILLAVEASFEKLTAQGKELLGVTLPADVGNYWQGGRNSLPDSQRRRAEEEISARPRKLMERTN